MITGPIYQAIVLGKPQPDGEGPKRVITSIVRIKRQDNGEWLYSYGYLTRL